MWCTPRSTWAKKTRNFWQLRLPRETRNHVPKFYAALKIGLNPEKYGFTVAQNAPAATETITVDFCVDFEVLAKRGRRALRVHLGCDCDTRLEVLKRAFEKAIG